MPTSPTLEFPEKKNLRSRWARPEVSEAPGPTPEAPPVPTVAPPVLARRKPPIPRHAKPKRGPKVIKGRINRSISVPFATEMRIRAFLDKTNVVFAAWVVRLIENDLDARKFPEVMVGNEPL